VVASSAALEDVVVEVIARLLDGGRELLTVLVGEGEDAARALEAVEALRDSHQRVEIDVHEGGQPFYPLLLSAE
jgi:dihydroxyacetone kinase-like predicted kinase